MAHSLTAEQLSFYRGHVDRERREQQWFFDRIRPFFTLDEVRDRDVVDFGSGLGSLAIEIAMHTPRSVVGVEISEDYRSFGDHHLRTEHPHLAGLIRYAGSLSAVPDRSADIIISKDVLEHVLDFDKVFAELCGKLKPLGMMILGFGPLWYSPYGGHGLNKCLGGLNLPYLHLLLPRPLLLSKSEATTFEEAGFNRLPYKHYENTIKNSGLQVEFYDINLSSNKLSHLLDRVVRPLPDFLQKYFVRTVYCKLVAQA